MVWTQDEEYIYGEYDELGAEFYRDISHLLGILRRKFKAHSLLLEHLDYWQELNSTGDSVPTMTSRHQEGLLVLMRLMCWHVWGLKDKDFGELKLRASLFRHEILTLRIYHLLENRGDLIDSIKVICLVRNVSGNYIIGYTPLDIIDDWVNKQADNALAFRNAADQGLLPDAADLYVFWKANSKFYKVHMQGENFRIGDSKVGFYSSRMIESDDIEKAKHRALDLIWKEARFSLEPVEDETSSISVTDIDLVTVDFGRFVNQGSLIFYPMTENHKN